MNFILGGNPVSQLGKGLDQNEGGNTEQTEEARKEAEEIEAARLEEEDRRKEKHRKMEEERETMRQDIRDKYNIKKKESKVVEEFVPGQIGRKKKTPGELEEEDEDEESIIPTAIREKLPDVKKFIPQSVQEKMPDMPGQCKPS